ncbi:DUF5053 domain-containing protein [Sinomicrobium soli]|uniref:DUF5053 domain-containing protein n=1 Tax=Sinomicrobium sp. N-1-3-6 TaxID=2219864 RepID=UPI000DCDF3EA|nr:DUF5053 domain-containing protein [Sinomicrobium sp. N-1-3-6]RAV31076.1 DUF5053 domain-containing protein [Sinomicrobium sp. N-1-3-6]
MAAVKENQSVKNVLSDILLSVKWAHISTHYFGKSRSWFSQRLNGYDGNNTESGFSDNDRATLKKALYDLSERIRFCADKI